MQRFYDADADQGDFGIHIGGFGIDEYRRDLLRTYNEVLRPQSTGRPSVMQRGSEKWMASVVARLRLDSLDVEADLPSRPKALYATSDTGLPPEFACWAEVMPEYILTVFDRVKRDQWVEEQFSDSPDFLKVWRALPTGVLQSDTIR